MIVTLDGNRVEKEFNSGTTLQTVIEDIRAGHPENCMVVGVAVDGRECSEQDLQDLLPKPLEGIGQVDLETGDPYEIGAVALNTVADQIAMIGKQQEEIAGKLNAGEIAAGVTKLADFVQAWQIVQRVIAQIGSLIGLDLTTVEYDNQPVSEYLDELLHRLREVRDALDDRDMVLLADLIHYEVPVVCETWEGLLKHLAGVVKEANPNK